MTRREEIEQQASLTVFPWDDVSEQSKFEDGFIEGAKWADKTIIDKACEWLEDIDYVMQYHYSEDGCTFFNKDKFIKDFRKTMEE